MKFLRRPRLRWSFLKFLETAGRIHTMKSSLSTLGSDLFCISERSDQFVMSEVKGLYSNFDRSLSHAMSSALQLLGSCHCSWSSVQLGHKSIWLPVAGSKTARNMSLKKLYATKPHGTSVFPSRPQYYNFHPMVGIRGFNRLQRWLKSNLRLLNQHLRFLRLLKSRRKISQKRTQLRAFIAFSIGKM